MKNKIYQLFSLILAFMMLFQILPVQATNAAELNEQATLVEAVELLNSTTMLQPEFGTDTNLNEFTEKWLASKGFDGIDVQIEPEEDVLGKNSSVKEDGTIAYFFVDPDTDVSTSNNGGENLKITFRLSLGNATQVSQTKTVRLTWDETKVTELMTERGLNFIQNNLNTLISPNVNSQNLTQNFTLPEIIDGKGWMKTSWTSDSPSLSIGAASSSFPKTFPVTIKQTEENQIVNLTATMTFNKFNYDDIQVQKSYQVTIPGIDLSDIKESMQKDLDEYFVPEVLKYSYPNASVSFDAQNVLHDIQLPTSSNIRKDTKDADGNIVSKGISDLTKKYITSGTGFSFYTFEKANENQSGEIIRNGYRGGVSLPKDGESPAIVNMTMTLTHKSYDLSVSKTIPLTLNPTDYDAMMAKVRKQAELMDLVKMNFFNVINGNPALEPNADANHITSDLSPFYEVRFKNPEDPTDKTLEYIYRSQEEKGDGIQLMPIPGYETQEAWRMLKSSHPNYLHHESLDVTRPTYDTDVTVEAMLYSPSFERYKDYFGEVKNEDSALLEALFNQPIKQKLTLLGEKGPLPEGETTTQTVKVIVEGSKLIEKKEDHATANEVWAEREFVFEKGTGKTTEELLRELMSINNADIEMQYGMLQSVKMPDKPENRNQITNGANSYWMMYEKIAETTEYRMTNYGLGQTIPENVESIKIKFVNDPSYPSAVKDEILSPEKAIEIIEDENTDGWWTGYRGDEQNNSPVKEKTELGIATQNKVWSYLSDEKSEWGTAANLSDLLIVNGKIYFAVANRLIELNEDGSFSRETELRGKIGYVSRPVYRGGILLIPLEGGAVQAIYPSTLETAWVTGSVDMITLYSEDEQGNTVTKDYPLQIQGTTYVKDNIAYIPLSAVESFQSVGGVLRAVDITTGAEKWRYINNEAGYYWAGATQIGDYILIGDDSGQIAAIKTDGSNLYNPIIFKDNQSSIRSTMVQDSGKLYFTTVDGVLHELEFDGLNGTFGAHRKVQFAANSSSTPSIYKGKIYVGGAAGEWAGGIFAVIDQENMTADQTYPVDGNVQSAPLIVQDGQGKHYVYFTVNTQDGFLYVFDAQKKIVEKAYVPGSTEAEYTNASPILGPDGKIYYTTDAGAIISLVSGQLIEEYDLTYDFSRKPEALRIINAIHLENPVLLQNSTLSINDRTANMTLLYEEEIKRSIGDGKFIAFQTNFSGTVKNNPKIRFWIEVDTALFSIDDTQELALYRLYGTEFIKVDLNKELVKVDSNSRNMSLSIFFEQPLQDNTTYVLAAVKKEVQPAESEVEESTNVSPKETQAESTNAQGISLSRTGERTSLEPWILGVCTVMLLSSRFYLLKKKKVNKN